MFEIISEKYNLVENISNSYGFRKPEELIRSGSQQLDNLLYRIQYKTINQLSSKRSKLELLKSFIGSYDTKKILERGFTLIKQKDKIVKRSTELDKKIPIKIKFCDNEIEVN
jgi:exonuclease VII large subunit